MFCEDVKQKKIKFALICVLQEYTAEIIVHKLNISFGAFLPFIGRKQ